MTTWRTIRHHRFDPRIIDLTGKRFGRWTVLSYSGRRRATR